HEVADFAFRPAPVLCGKSIERQILDADVRCMSCDTFDILHTLIVAIDPRSVPLLGVSAVAIHDDRDMFRQYPLPRRLLLLFPTKHVNPPNALYLIVYIDNKL